MNKGYRVANFFCDNINEKIWDNIHKNIDKKCVNETDEEINILLIKEIEDKVDKLMYEKFFQMKWFNTYS